MEVLMRLQIDSNRRGVDYVGPVPPSNPTPGYLWFDSSTNKLKSWTGTFWRWDGADPFMGGDLLYLLGGIDPSAGSTTTIERISIDGITSFVSGFLNEGVQYSCAGCNSSINGYMFGGVALGVYTTKIYRMNFSIPSQNSISGNLANTTATGSSFNSSLHGFVCGGLTAGGNFPTSIINRILFNIDVTANNVGNLTKSKYRYTGLNCSTHGYNLGGITGGGSPYTQFSDVDRMTFPNDASTSSVVGSLTNTRMQQASFNSSLYGYNGTGLNGGGASLNTSNMDRLIFPFSSGTASSVGNASGTKNESVGVNSTIYGFIAGGQQPGNLSTIDRFQFPFDSGVVQASGNLSGSRQVMTPVDNTDFVAMFV
jgi:hypothetical protein